MNARQRRRQQRLYTKEIANDLILFRLLGGSASMAGHYRAYNPRQHGVLLHHLKELQEKPA